MKIPQEKKYAAFISYRHLSPDMEIARALAKMLEHNMIRPNRTVKRNIAPVFLDVNELPLTESLDASIIHALEESEILIVICSPNLPLSKYCMREISYFKEIHGGKMDRIYTLLVDGDPMSSFPDVLRTEQVNGKDADGHDTTFTVEVEPLFADVRAATIKESIKKLRKTEYLRLAAAYYRCTYDDLYKRRKRWLWKLGMSSASIVVVAALGFCGYAYTRNLQYSTAKAATYASYAREQNEAGNEQLSITLCQEAWEEGVFSSSQRYMTALRSAAVQYDYKQRAVPISRLMTADYMDSENFNFYTSEDETTSLVHSDDIYQLTDTKTGFVMYKEAVDLMNVQASDVSWYVTIAAKADEHGVFQDVLELHNLDDQQLIKAIVLRPSKLTSPDYKLNIYVGKNVDQVLEITDDDERLILIDKQGNHVSEEELLQRAYTAVQQTPAEPAPFSVGITKILRKTSYNIKNATGEVMLTLDGDVKHTAFSPDWAWFACLADQQLAIYDTSTWTKMGQCTIATENVTAIRLLQDSTYAIVTHGNGDVTDNYALDWRTGSLLAEFGGTVQIGADHNFYTVYQGQVSTYHYTPLDLTSMPYIVAQKDKLLLTRNGSHIILIDSENGNALFLGDSIRPSFDIYNATSARVAYSDDLSRMLVRLEEGLHCYDQIGRILWQTGPNDSVFAMARDGSVAAWVDDKGNVCVVSAADGARLYDIPASMMTGITSPDSIAVSQDGLCICERNGDIGTCLWFPAGSSKAIDLGHYCAADLFADGTLILEGASYIQDFAVWNVREQAFLYQPNDNTGAWAYSPRTGYLARHLQTSGNHNTLEIELLQLRKGKFVSCGRIPLPDVALSSLKMDSAGEVLSITAGDTTFVYRMKNLSPLLETTGAPLYYENGAFYSEDLLGGQLYTVPMLEGDALHNFAAQIITSDAGQRELSLAELSRYSFEE